jgi:hypothetical protein
MYLRAALLMQMKAEHRAEQGQFDYTAKKSYAVND